MLVKFQGTWRGHEILVNPAHVKTLRPMTEQEGPYGQRKSFAVAGQTLIEYSVLSNEDELFTDTVIGTLDEVAAKLNAVSSKHFEKALAMAIEFDQRRATEAPCKS